MTTLEALDLQRGHYQLSRMLCCGKLCSFLPQFQHFRHLQLQISLPLLLHLFYEIFPILWRVPELLNILKNKKNIVTIKSFLYTPPSTPLLHKNINIQDSPLLFVLTLNLILDFIESCSKVETTVCLSSSATMKITGS